MLELELRGEVAPSFASQAGYAFHCAFPALEEGAQSCELVIGWPPQ